MRTRYWLISIGVIIAFFAVREWYNQSKTDDLIKNISAYTDTVKIERLKNGAVVASNASLNLQSQYQIKALAASINDTVRQMLKRFKSVNNVTYVTNTFAAGGDTSKYAKSIPCDFKPFKVQHTDSTYTFKGTVAKDYFRIDTIVVPNKITLISGRKKVGFMKYDNGVDINNSNPLMVTTNVRSYQYSPEKKFYEKTWFHLAIGALAGTIINETKNIYIKKL